MRIPHPIPYQGSKRGIAEAILAYFPQHVTRLVEPFAGSAAVTIAAAACYRADRFWLNDLNEPLMRLWDAIIHRPEQLAEAYENLWKEQQGREREYYDTIRAEFNRTHQPEYLLYLLARCVKASVRYNAMVSLTKARITAGAVCIQLPCVARSWKLPDCCATKR